MLHEYWKRSKKNGDLLMTSSKASGHKRRTQFQMEIKRTQVFPITSLQATSRLKPRFRRDVGLPIVYNIVLSVVNHARSKAIYVLCTPQIELPLTSP
jgi:hypothetical protein